MAEATAWIVTLDEGCRAAVGEREMMHLVETPVLEAIPHTPVHCRRVLRWEGEIMPVIDLSAWLTGQPTEGAQASVAIVGWQVQTGAVPQYGALLFRGVPQKTRVQDEQFCQLPDSPSGWGLIAVSCFSHDGLPVPILDLRTIFSDALVRHAAGLPLIPAHAVE